MDPFVTQIGDVTIQRLAPKNSPSEDKTPEDGPETTKSSTVASEANEGSSSTEPAENRTVKSPLGEPIVSKNEDESSHDEVKNGDESKEAKVESHHADEDIEKTVNADKSEGHDENEEQSDDKGEIDGGDIDPSQFLETAHDDDVEGGGNEDENMAPADEAFMSGKSEEEPESGGENPLEDETDNGEMPSRGKRKASNGRGMKLEPVEESERMEDGDDDNDTLDDGSFAATHFLENPNGQDFEALEGEEMALDEDGNLRAQVEGDMEEGKYDISNERIEIKTEPEESKLDTNLEGEGGGIQEDEGEPDIKKKLRTRQKRKIVVEDDSDDSEEERRKKRKKRKKKGAKDDNSETSEETESEDDGSGKKKKKKKKPAKKGSKKKDDDDDGSGDGGDRKKSNMRRNIRDVMDETKLDEATLAAQRQEMERLQRVQEQQRILREMAQQRQQQQRAEHKVLSLLQGNTSILKQVSVSPSQSSKGSSSSGSQPNTVVVKVGSGANAQANKKVLELLRVPKGTTAEMKPLVTKTLLGKPRALQGTTMMTPSVSIAPVRAGAASQKSAAIVKQPSMIQAQASYSASEGEGEGEEEEEEEEFLDEVVDEEGKKKKKDVVTISSSSSSEDDCIVLSEPSDLEEDEEPEDPTNSGMHTNDNYNVPDDEGRVQVNMGKPEADPDIFLAPHIARIIKPHQIGGIRFLYDNVIESIERFNTSTGFGCILAHSMGLGKTLQVITFCDIFLRHTPGKTVMCIMPINTLQNWLAEFNMWMPEDALATPLAAQGEIRPRTFSLYVLNDSHKTLKARAKVVEDWSKTGGVLLIGYEMYRQLSLKKVSKPKKSRRKRVVSDDEEVDPEEEEKRQKEILEKVYEALVKPGPDLVICDEGHRIKNSHASISMALKQIRSKRRIVLTGYPLQNNLLEYWCMVDFVRPNYLGTKTEFSNMFERPIQNGQCIDSTPQDIRLMRYRAHVLHSLLEGFVQRRSHAVLQSALPQKEEYVLLVRMTPFQRNLYETFMNEVVRTKAVPNPLKAFAVCCKIWNHPDVLYQFLKKREGGEGVDLDLEEAAAALAANTVTDPTGTPVEERRTAAKTRGRPGNSKNRRKKDTTPVKPAAAVLPNTSSQNDPTNPYGLSGQYPLHGQMNSNALMGSYNPYGAGQSSYGSFNVPHHYNPSSSYAHSGYSGASGFNSGSSSMGLNTPAQSSFTGSGSSGYGDSLASSPASQSSQYGSSSSQSMFTGPSSSNPSSSSTSGYGSMGPPYFSGNTPSGQHSMQDGFTSSGNYNQSWNSSSSNYNSFNQGSSSSQSFPGSSFSSSGQNPSFQGYGGSSSSSYNQSMYGSGSSGSASSSTQSYQSGLIDQQMLDQNLMAPPNRPNLNPNLIPQQSPVNASGMLPGGAPTKNPSMMPPSMGSNLMGSGMGVGLSSSVPGIAGMTDNMMGHHSQGMGMPSNMYQNPNIMNLSSQPSNHSQSGPMSALSTMASADVPPSAEDLLHSASDDFRAFDPSLGKAEPGRGMYDVKDRNMFDPWGNSHSHTQDFSMMNSQDVKALPNSGVKKTESDKYNPGPSPLDQLKNEMSDVKLEDKTSNNVEDKEMGLDSDNRLKGHNDQDTKVPDESESWRVDSMEVSDKDKDALEENKEKEGKEDEEESQLGVDGKAAVETSAIIKTSGKDMDPGIPYDWAVELMKDYVPGLIENSAKMVLFFCILEESLALGDRILLFSQSLFTLSLIEDYLQRSFIPVPGVYERWQRNRTYFRLDGSTAALEREKLINEFNANPNVYLFLVSTRAGSLGINLVGANRVIVFDASWNPCHDTQAVCRVYRYGQRKPCYVYRFVMDNCLEKKIYDRQINKQGMSDRVVDECNPDAHLSIKEVTNLCWDDEKETEVKDLSDEKDKYRDQVMQKLVEKHGKLLSKAPFQHESLLVDRKDKKLSQAEKRLAKRSYEMEKRANNRPVYNYYNANQGGLQIRPVQRDAAGNVIKPIASVRPMQSELNTTLATGNRNSKWIPAEVWQRQGMSAQEMTLPLDVVIPTNSPERSSIVLKAGQRVMVLKSPKGIYMQLENGKIIAIRTALKMGANNKTDSSKPFAIDKDDLKKGIMNKGNIKLTSGIHPLRNNPNITITPRTTPGLLRSSIRPILNRPPGARMQTTANMRPWIRPGGVAGRAVPLRPNQNLKPGFRGLSPSVTVTPASLKARTLGPVTITPRLAPANFPGMTKSVDQNKDKSKTEGKSETKVDENEKFESDDAQSSNSSLDLPFSSSKQSAVSNTNSVNVNETGIGKEKQNEEKQNNENDGHFETPSNESKQPGVDQPNSFNDTVTSENRSADGLLNSAGSAVNQNTQDLSMNSAPDSTNSSLKNFRHASSSQRRLQEPQQSQDLHNLPSQENRGTKPRENSHAHASSHNSAYSGSNAFGSSEKTQTQSAQGFPGNFSNSLSSLNKQYGSNVHSGSILSPSNYSTSADHSLDDPKSASSMDTQWKSPPAPQAFSPGVPSSKSASQHRSLESPAFDDNSNTSIHSNLSSKSSAPGSSIEPRAQTAVDPSSYLGTDLSLSKSSSKTSSTSIPPSSNLSSSSNTKLNPSSSSSTSGGLSSSSSNFPPLDPYANLYGSYGAYAGGLPASNYYNPYSYPTGFLPDPKGSLSSKSSTESNQNTSAPASRSNSKSSSSRSETKKSSHEPPRSSLPAAYDSRQSSSTGSSSTSRSAGSSSTLSSVAAAASSSSAASDTGPFSTSSSAAAAAAAYNPMMMSPSFNPTSCQYPPPSAASGSTNPFTAAAAAAATYPNPYASPYGYPGSNQFESDLARASMYSAFHRPDAGLDATSPYLALPAHTRPMTGAAPPAGSFYSQNMYGGQYGGTRDPYAQLPPYAASPFIMPPAPYGGLASSATSTATSDQSPSQ